MWIACIMLVVNKDNIVNKEDIYTTEFMKENSEYITILKPIGEEEIIEYDKQVTNKDGETKIEEYVNVETKLQVIMQYKGDIKEAVIKFVNYTGHKIEKQKHNYVKLERIKI